MATNTMVLIVVAAFAALVLASVLALVAYKTRTQQRHGNGETIRDQAEEDALDFGVKKRSPTSSPRGPMRPRSRSTSRRSGRAACNSKRRPIEAKQSPPATN